jgi:phage terminase Nu1 subunit (DNA packaging protein)
VEAILLIFLRLLVPLGILGGAAYLLFGPGRAWLTRLLAGEPPYLREARAIADRIAINLKSAAPAVAEKCLADIDGLVEHRLPRILEQYDRLSNHLAASASNRVADEVASLESKLLRTKDPGLRTLLQENMELARQRLGAREKMQLLLERTEAQLKQVLLYLEAFESKSVSLGVSESGDDVPAEMERMLEEITTIESMYRDLDGPESAGRADQENALEAPPQEADRTRGAPRRRRSREE